MTVLKWIVICAGLGYVGVVAAMYLAQRSILYPIPTATRTTPKAAGFAQAEEQFLTAADGERVIVWHVAPQPGRRVVIYFPGNGDTLANSAGRLDAITSDGTGLVALSYRGYAGSTGARSERGLLNDAAVTYAFAAAIYDPRRIVLWGFSLGSGAAVAIAAEHPVGGLILEAPYSLLGAVAPAAYLSLPVRYLLKDKFRSDQRIERVTAPLLIMHGTIDRTIPIIFGERLFAMAREPKQFVRF